MRGSLVFGDLLLYWDMYRGLCAVTVSCTLKWLGSLSHTVTSWATCRPYITPTILLKCSYQSLSKKNSVGEQERERLCMCVCVCKCKCFSWNIRVMCHRVSSTWCVDEEDSGGDCNVFVRDRMKEKKDFIHIYKLVESFVCSRSCMFSECLPLIWRHLVTARLPTCVPDPVTTKRRSFFFCYRLITSCQLFFSML